MDKNKLNQQCAKCRGASTKLFLKGEKCHGPKCALIKRNFPAGQHGLNQKRHKKSDYGKQLAEKQRAKKIYGVLERQFSNYLREADKKHGDTGEYLLNFLESRLDNVAYRMGLATSRRAARQLVSHNHITVNGKKLNIPSYRVMIGDVVALSDKAKTKNLFSKITEKLSKVEHVSWMSVDAKKASAKILNAPTTANPPFGVKSIIEFYSRKI